MEDQSKEISQLIEDFHYLKNAVMRSNRVFKFISSNTFRPLYLLMGLLIIVFTSAVKLLMEYYGSYGNIPSVIRTTYYTALIALLIWAGYTKLRLMITQIKKLGLDITVWQFFKEVYTWNTAFLMIPYLVTMGLLAIFLVNRGLGGYVIPCLAILYGLMINTATSLLYLREFIVGGIWFILSGFVILFVIGP